MGKGARMSKWIGRKKITNRKNLEFLIFCCLVFRRKSNEEDEEIDAGAPNTAGVEESMGWVRCSLVGLALVAGFSICCRPLAARPGPPVKAGVKLDWLGNPLPEGAVARLGCKPMRVDPGSELRFSPDGKELIAAGRAGVQFWDAATGKLRRDFSAEVRGRSPFLSRDAKVLLRLLPFWVRPKHPFFQAFCHCGRDFLQTPGKTGCFKSQKAPNLPGFPGHSTRKKGRSRTEPLRAVA
jgi:hypothetical protein